MSLISKPAFVAATTVLLASSIFVTSASANTLLAAHRAVYDVKLKEASDRSGIDGMSGRIVYEFRGTACDGYTTKFRFVTRLSARGEVNMTDQRTSTFEDGSGENFRFVTKTYVNENEDKNIEGSATSQDGSVIVDLKRPEPLELDLNSALFPTKHVLDLIDRAQAGETFYEEQIFDGSDGGDRVLTTTVVIGPQKSEPTEDAADETLEGELYRNISVAYFDEVNDPEGLPEYSIAFKLHDNGISRDLEMDYGDFVLTGEMTSLELFEPESCDG